MFHHAGLLISLITMRFKSRARLESEIIVLRHQIGILRRQMPKRLVLAMGAGLGGIWTVSVVMVGSRFRGADLSAAYAAGGVLHGIGMVAGPIVSGFASAALDPVAVPLLVALCCLLYLPATLVRPAGRATKPWILDGRGWP